MAEISILLASYSKLYFISVFMAEWEIYLMRKILPSDVITLKACLYSSLTGGTCYKVMLESGNYDLVHEFFGKMKRSGEVPKALTYKGSSLLPSYYLLLIFGNR